MQKGFEAVNLHGTASGIIAVPVIGENGNWWIGNQDTGIAAQGDQGEQGVPGPQGSKGEKGETGCMGPQGPQGERGLTGAQGPKGDKGDQGSVGAMGPQGNQGVKGDKGETGAKGEDGPAGSQGPKGADADRGDIERLDAAVEKLDSDKANLTANKYTGIQKIEALAGVSENGYENAQLFIKSRTDLAVSSRACIGFENTGRFAATLYMENDGSFRIICSDGGVYQINTTKL